MSVGAGRFGCAREVHAQNDKDGRPHQDGSPAACQDRRLWAPGARRDRGGHVRRLPTSAIDGPVGISIARDHACSTGSRAERSVVTGDTRDIAFSFIRDLPGRKTRSSRPRDHEDTRALPPGRQLVPAGNARKGRPMWGRTPDGEGARSERPGHRQRQPHGVATVARASLR